MSRLTELFKSWGEWIRFGLVIAFVLGTSWLSTHYVSQEQYRTDLEATEKWRNETTKNLKDLTAAVSALATAVKVESEQVNIHQDKLLADHEARIRALEDNRRKAERYD